MVETCVVGQIVFPRGQYLIDGHAIERVGIAVFGIVAPLVGRTGGITRRGAEGQFVSAGL